MVIPDRDTQTPTPTPRSVRARAATAFQLGGDERDETEDGDSLHFPEDDEVAGVTLDDDDFESHYSRQESPESEEEVSGEEDETEGDVEDEYQQGPTSAGDQFHSSNQEPRSLSRVHSLPVRPHPQPHPPESNVSGGGLHISQSTTSLPPAPPPPLYPPFYNRPPTPLPPSPSLTSLLRPPSLLNRSTTSTRPTTPEDSDAETPNDTEAAVAQSARRAHPLPPTSPKVPTYEYYGFVLYLASTIAFLMYILWSYLPSPFLHAMGVTYYPNRWWSLAIPAWIVMLLIFIYVALLSYNVEYLTLPLASLECMVDEAANVAILDENGRVRNGGSKRLVKEMEQQAAMEQASARGKKGRKFSKSKDKDKAKQRKRPSLGGANGTARANDVHGLSHGGTEMSNGTARASSYHDQLAYQNTAIFPYLANGSMHVENGRHGQFGALGYPNWKMTWNEGTDAVMDVPIGGVCEVLYG